MYVAAGMAGRNIVSYVSLLSIFCGDHIAAQLGRCANGDITSLRDGRCDDNNNNEECLYDGGDCCPCSCINGSKGAIVSFGEEVSFLNNTAVNEGAIYVTGDTKVSWTGYSTFSGNAVAPEKGGALYVTNGSSGIWLSEAQFLNNSAGGFGGAVFVGDGSSVVWAATSYFDTSTAIEGGALSLLGGSTAAWSAESFFFANRAYRTAGGVLVLLPFGAQIRCFTPTALGTTEVLLP